MFFSTPTIIIIPQQDNPFFVKLFLEALTLKVTYHKVFPKKKNNSNKKKAKIAFPN